MQRARSNVLARVARTVVAHRMVEAGARVLVALSGGPDSVGLLAILAALRRKLQIELVAGHVNHHLRGADSDADERCAADAAAHAGVQFVRADLRGLGGGANLEARAREQRYRALHRLAAAADCERIATGHTRDDQAETVLLRLIRGSGVGGLAGIEPLRGDGVMRPLLDCTRADVARFVRDAEYRYRIDASNRDRRFLRTRVRYDVLPLLRELNPGIIDNLVRLATLSSAERTIVHAWTVDHLRQMQHRDGLNLDRLVALPADLQGHIIRAWLVDVGAITGRLTARHVDAVRRLATSALPSGVVTVPGAVIARRYERLRRYETAPGGIPPSVLAPGRVAAVSGGWRITVDPHARPRKGMRLPSDLWTAVCDATALSRPLWLRAPRVGERVRPLGLDGRHRKLSDLFIDRKVPAAERKNYPVVAYGDEVLWVPGVMRSELLRVCDDTTTVMRLRAERRPTSP